MSRDAGIKENVGSIDQILERIKRAINEDEKEIEDKVVVPPPSKPTDSEVLELTNVISNDKDEVFHNKPNSAEEGDFDLISQHIQSFTSKLNGLMQGNYVASEKEVREIFKETLRPYLKSWLNNNLQGIVKEILEAEVKDIFKRVYNA